MLTLAFNIQSVRASGIIYIRPDGSIDPPTANITSSDNITYSFTTNINDAIVVERSNIIIDGNGYTLQGSGSGKGFSVDSNNITIQNTDVRNFTIGIHIWASSFNTISENNITHCRTGIRLLEASYNTISRNNIANGTLWSDGIDVSNDANHNTISANTLSNNDRGIGVWNSFHNSIFNNTASSNAVAGILLSGSSHNVISNNAVFSNTVRGIYVYHPSCNNNTFMHNTVSDNLHGIMIRYAVNNTVTGCTFSNNDIGIYFSNHSNSNLIWNNVVSNNNEGIRLELLSNQNTIRQNNVTKNYYGYNLDDSSNNEVYHNNFIENTEYGYTYESANVWDDNYPSGGNYWSDYTDVDLYRGPQQDIAGSDGIWDHPYVIDANNTDNYPLKKPCVPGNLTVSIYTDKYTYHAGDTMHLGLNVTNPDSVKYVCVAIWVELPSSSIYVYMHKHSVVLPIGLNYANPAFDSITLPSLPSGNYTWHAAFLKRTTHTMIVEDTAEWQFI